MIMHDVSQEKNIVLLLIHPMLSSAMEMERCIGNSLADKYRLLIPDLSGHGEAAGETFKSAMREAKEIHTYLKDQGIEKVDLAFGASLGGVVLLELLRYGDISYGGLIFEGTSCYEKSRLMGKVMDEVFAAAQYFAKISKRFAARVFFGAYGKDYSMAMAETYVSLNRSSIRHIMRDCSRVRFPKLGQELQKNCVFAYGSKDRNLKRAKKVIPERYPYARLKIWPRLKSCVKLALGGEEYVRMIEAMCGK